MRTRPYASYGLRDPIDHDQAVPAPQATLGNLPGTYRTRFGRLVCTSCGYAVPQHAEDCAREWTEGEKREGYGK